MTLASGRGRFVTTPAPTKSPTATATTGTVVIERLAARAPSDPYVTTRSTLSRMRSVASWGSRSYWPSAQRYSTQMLSPSMYPRSRRPRRNASRNRACAAGVVSPRKPTRGIVLRCCPWTAIGQPATPPSIAMNSRRRMSVPRLRRMHRIGSIECFDRGRRPASLLQHEMLADVRCGSLATVTTLNRYGRYALRSGHPSEANISAKCQAGTA